MSKSQSKDEAQYLYQSNEIQLPRVTCLQNNGTTIRVRLGVYILCRMNVCRKYVDVNVYDIMVSELWFSNRLIRPKYEVNHKIQPLRSALVMHKHLMDTLRNKVNLYISRLFSSRSRSQLDPIHYEVDFAVCI